MGIATLLGVLAAAVLPAQEAAGNDLLSGKFSWTSGPPLVAPADRPDDPCVAIKDPSLVFHGDRWHVYATIKCRSGTRMEALSFADFRAAGTVPRREIALVKTYHGAPQVLWFAPQKRWYLICQWGDDARKYFGPCFSTLEDPAKPETLTPPVMLYPEKPAGLKGWLDFWVIADPAEAGDRRMHLFFTSLDGKMWRAETKIADFPHGWGEPKVVLQGDVFEASHTYRLKGMGKYLTIIEAQAGGGRRYYKAYLADRLDGEWKPLADTPEQPFAGPANVRFAAGVEPWTDSFSHGELLREGADETMTVDPSRLRFFFQGCNPSGRAGKGYGQFSWRLGLLEPAGR
jgi:hypothetical protein